MNQDQVKTHLLGLRESVADFVVVFSGKQSKKVNGLYKPETAEIVIHNRNFASDNDLMYTAVHEFAHHVHVTESPMPLSSRAHTAEFWALFHDLLRQAEQKELHTSMFETNEEFVQLTKEIKERFVFVSGKLMKDLGALLLKAHTLCEKHRASFFDYLDRVLNLPRSSATTVIKAFNMDLDPNVGFENMRTLTRIGDSGKRSAAQKALLQGMSPDWVKHQFVKNEPVVEPLERLLAERERTERQIKRLQVKLIEIERRIERVDKRSAL